MIDRLAVLQKRKLIEARVLVMKIALSCRISNRLSWLFTFTRNKITFAFNVIFNEINAIRGCVAHAVSRNMDRDVNRLL